MKKLMLVDDEIEILEMISDQLPVNWKVDSFTNAREAIAHYSKNPNYDYVVTDLKMSLKTGEGLIFDIKYLNSKQKIFVITGDSSKINLPPDFQIKVFQKPEGIRHLVSELKLLL